MRVHVRGQLGTQLIQAFVGIGRLGPDETPTIVVNSGGGVAGAKTSQLHWVTDPQCEIREDSDGVRKTPYWNPGAASMAFRGREKTLKYLPLLDRQPEPETKSTTKKIVVHVRGGDKDIASIDTYRKLVELAKQKNPRADIVIIGDDDNVLDKLQDLATVVTGEPEADWFRVLDANHVYCGPSAFVGSTLLYDTKKKVSVMGKNWCDGSYHALEDDLVFFEEAKSFCPNLEILV